MTQARKIPVKYEYIDITAKCLGEFYECFEAEAIRLKEEEKSLEKWANRLQEHYLYLKSKADGVHSSGISFNEYASEIIYNDGGAKVYLKDWSNYANDLARYAQALQNITEKHRRLYEDQEECLQEISEINS